MIVRVVCGMDWKLEIRFLEVVKTWWVLRHAQLHIKIEQMIYHKLIISQSTKQYTDKCFAAWMQDAILDEDHVHA